MQDNIHNSKRTFYDSEHTFTFSERIFTVTHINSNLKYFYSLQAFKVYFKCYIVLNNTQDCSVFKKYV